MSILIKGMEMPKSCDECPMFNIEIDGGCYCTKYFVIRKKDQDRPDWCPLVPVPQPHGRLIDADALAVHKFAGAEHDISIEDGGACYRRGWNDAIEAIMENAETIIGGE